MITKASKRSLAQSLKSRESHELSPLSYVDAFKVPREVSIPFLNLVGLWIRSTGVEDTVKRLKDIKTDFIRSYAGLPMVAPYVARNRAKNRFRGPLKGLQTWGYASEKKFTRAIQLLQVYTLFYSPTVTDAQKEKFLKGVMASPTNISIPIQLGILQASNAIPVCTGLGRPKSFILNHPRSPSKREPRADGSSSPEGEKTLDIALDWLNFITVECRRDSSAKSLVRLMHESLRDLDGRLIIQGTRDKNVRKELGRSLFSRRAFNIGKIGFIQEPGFKLRAVANPSRLVQHALEPLGTYLFKSMRYLPWDCTFNQSKAFPVIQEHLKNDNMIHSVDLTDASSYFPLSLQKIMLNHVFPNDADYVDAFLYASQAPWIYKDGESSIPIKWTKGQPLGLYPSFASAFLTHGFLLLYLNEFQHKNDFFVLGDDVVILNDQLYTKYVNTLAELSCPVSEAKCISSTKVAEFAGKVITKSLIMSQLKWRNPSDDSFLDIVRNIGIGALKLLRPRQRVIAEKLLDIPSEFGGIGLNPKGLPLSERVFKALQMKGESVNSYLMSYNWVVNKLMYNAVLPTTGISIKETSADCFDKKQIAYVMRHLPNLIRFYDVLGKNLYAIEPDLDLTIEGSSNFRSLLCTLEASLS